MVAGVYLCTAAGRAILDDGDALYAHVAQNMAASGDWVTPYADGERFLDKPPMLYWLTAASYHIFGIFGIFGGLGSGEFAVRFPAVLAVLGVSLLLFFMGRRVGGPVVGFVAGASFALSVGTFLFTRMAFPDIFFVFFLTLAVAAFLRWYRDDGNPVAPALWFYAATAGAVLSKGLIGIFFPAVTVLLFLLWSRSFKRLRRFHVGKGTVLFLLLAAPWHILAAVRNPGFLWYYFVNEQFLRFFGKRQPLDYESISLPVFWLLVLAWLFPWSAFFPALRHVWRGMSSLPAEARDVIRICAVWVLVILVFFSVSSRIEHYSMPIFPPLVLLVGVAFSRDRTLADGTRKSMTRGFAFLGVLGLLAALLLVGGILWLEFGLSGQHPAGASAGARLHAYKYYFAPLFDMPPDVVGKLKTPLIGTLATLAAGLGAAWLLDRRFRRMAAVMALNLTMAGFCLFAWQSLGVCEDVTSSRQFGRKLAQLHRPGDAAVVLGDFETANSVNFYAPVPLYIYKGSAALLSWGMRYPDAPQLLLSDGDFQSRWSGESRTFLLAPEDQVSALELPFSFTVLRSAGRVLLCNKEP
jgi:4-amino-4-deoxy-L-arabinose transferase-like glycosyltransferase